MSVSRRQDVSGRKVWTARGRKPGGGQYRKDFALKGDADRFDRRQQTAIDSGTYIDRKAGDATFREYAEAWRVMQAHRPSTRAQVETHLRGHVYPMLGHRKMSTIRPSQVQAMITGLSHDLAPATVTVVSRIVSGIFRAAVRDRVISAPSPADGVKLPKRIRRQVVPLTVDQVHDLADAVPDRWRAAVILAAGAGLRQGEVLGLTLDRIDFLRRTVRIDRQLLTLAGAEPVLAQVKTAASNRTIPLPQVVVDALAAHLAAYPAARDGLVFPDADGRPMRRTTFSRLWRPAVRAAGVPEGTGFHALRHHYASLLIRYGESVKTVQARLGHASAAETLDTYSHLWPDSDDRTREAVDSALGAARVSTARPSGAVRN